jgi:NhaA family Na+:H+ antiporter
VVIPGSLARDALTSPLAIGIAAGLVLGKPTGVLAAAWLATRVGPGKLPEGVSWRDIAVVAVLGGIGFTVSLFLAELALGDSQVDTARLAILAACAIAGVLALATAQALHWLSSSRQASS